MKNPNHYGTVTKLSGNRRKPWVAKEGTSGKQKAIGYAATKEEALILLAQYNKAPWDIDADKITLQELYNLWLEKRAPRLSASNQKVLKAAYNHCISLAGCRYSQIKSYQMQDTIDACPRSYATKGSIKNLWGHLDRFAMELDIIQKRYSDLISAPTAPETTKKIFSPEEVALLWENLHYPWVDSVLFLLYTGFRISEMLNMKISDVDLINQTMTGGIKTDAGKNRIVPIHSKILPIVQQRYSLSHSGYLFENDRCKVPENTYRNIWADIMKKFNMDYLPHECRHTFRSRLDSAGGNKVCIDRLMGHKSQGTGERVYTHKNITELKLTIELVTN